MITRLRKTHLLGWSLIALGLTLVVALTAMGGAFAAISVWPAIGAESSDALREFIGDRAVAQLEAFAFQVEDRVHQWEYQVSGAPVAAPWTTTSSGDTLPAQDHYSAPGISAHGGGAPAASPGVAKPHGPQAGLADPVASTDSSWPLASIPALGSMTGEGRWMPYIQDQSGRPVAARTFLQPDPQRPYVVAAVVAFDLTHTRLHFVLGSDEPQSPVQIDRTGQIGAGDMRPGFLLADFNGGFKARHGHFGAMVNGVMVLPPRDGLGTVAMYDDGQVAIGEWGTDIVPSPRLSTWRQNGPLLIDTGQINPHTADGDPSDWGYTVNHATATWRSGIGISADGHALFYVAGPGLTLPTLAKALADAGAAEAIQLDINNYWVHFDAIQSGAGGLQAVPLLDGMKFDNNRYLKGFSRDFFYVTSDAG
ncbi:MAG: phosphodiester glycosidase family protein [Chloroflexi bacterium]|nr:phosphodiester glycosidase family protein [Chloroflexota bacterium]